MDSGKLRRVGPVVALSVLCAIAGLLRGAEPDFFFPAWRLGWVWAWGLAGAVVFAVWAFRRNHQLNRRREKALGLVLAVLEKRRALENPSENEIILAGRVVSRLTRNADEDLREIGADFSQASLGRLERYLPLLLDEVEIEEDAMIRLGVVGTYLGETFCRTGGWSWYFKPDPSLRQFSYLSSVIRRGGREWDPYVGAADLFGRRRKAAELRDEAQ